MAFQIPFKFSAPKGEAAIAERARPSKMMDYDQPLVWVVLILMLFGMVMVYSASIALPDSPKFSYLQGKHEYFLLRQAAFITVSVVAAYFAFRIPVAAWQKLAPLMFVGTLFMLILVLVPGVGVSVNGARRWLSLKLFQVQPSEIMKIVVVLYAADFTGNADLPYDFFMMFLRHIYSDTVKVESKYIYELLSVSQISVKIQPTTFNPLIIIIDTKLIC